MNRLMNPNSKEVRIMALVYIIAGILLFILNNDFLMIAVRIFGVILIAIGGTLLYTYFGNVYLLTPALCLPDCPVS